MQESTDDLWQRGHASLEDDDFPVALACFQQALSLEPDDHELIHIVGYTLQRLGRHAEAIDYFQDSIRRFPEFPCAYADLGDSLAIAGQLDHAREAYMNAIKLCLPGEETAEQAIRGLKRLES